MKHSGPPKDTPKEGASGTSKKESKAKREPEDAGCDRVHIAPIGQEVAKHIGRLIGTSDINMVLGYAMGLTVRILEHAHKGRIIIARDRTGEQRDVVIEGLLPPDTEAHSFASTPRGAD